MSWGALKTIEIVSGDAAAGRHAAMSEPVKAGYYWAVLHCGIADTDATAQAIDLGVIERNTPVNSSGLLSSTLATAIRDLHKAGFIRTMPGTGSASTSDMTLFSSQNYRQGSPMSGKIIIVPSGWRFVAFEVNSSASASAHQLFARLVYLEIKNENCIPFV